MRKLLFFVLLFLSACTNLSPQLWLYKSPNSLPVHIHPEGQLYVGDQVSFEVFDPGSTFLANSRVRISLSGKSLGEGAFGLYGMGGRSQATFYWVWDTNNLTPGDYTITFSVSPGALVSAKCNLDPLGKRAKASSPKDRERLPVRNGYPKSQNLEQMLLWTGFLDRFLGSRQVSF